MKITNVFLSYSLPLTSPNLYGGTNALCVCGFFFLIRPFALHLMNPLLYFIPFEIVTRKQFLTIHSRKLVLDQNSSKV